MKLWVLASLLVLAVIGPLQAGNADSIVQPAEPKEESIFDKIWSVPKLYRNDDNPVIEEFDLIGRFQQDYFNVDSDRGSTSFSEIRRFRLGVNASFLERHVEVEAEVDTALRAYDAPSVFYNRMTNLWARIKVSDAFSIRFGKFRTSFGYDREFSPNLAKTFEYGFFDDQLIGTNGYLTGAEATGKVGNLGYLATVFSTNVDKEFGRFDGGQAYHAEISYNFSKALQVKKASWVLDYLHAVFKNTYTLAVFTGISQRPSPPTSTWEKGRFSMVPQFAFGQQVDGKGDVYSLQIMPGYKITEKLEFIARYQLGLASESDGIATLNRQQKTVGTFTGDTYNAIYLGLNYYIYGDRLKLMFGEEYARLSGGTGPSAGFNGWTTMVGFRLFF